MIGDVIDENELVTGSREEVLVRLGISAGPILGGAAFVAVFIYARYQLGRKRHAEILVELETVAARANRRSNASQIDRI